MRKLKTEAKLSTYFMMNQYNLYKFIDAKSECLREAIDKVRDNHIEEFKRDRSHYNFIVPPIYKLMLVVLKLQAAPKEILYNLY